MHHGDVLTIVLAGGKGTRLEPLTRDRAKPAVPFGGQYRIIDFVLSNCINSHLRQILVLTQYKAASLDRHIRMGWQFLCRDLAEFVDIIPPQQRIDEHWYQGTADAIYQNIYLIEKLAPKRILVLAGDHIYKMDYGPMIDFHLEHAADLTIASLPVALPDAREFGVLEVDADSRVVSFVEKPPNPKPMPGDLTRALASMGIYIFDTAVLFDRLLDDAARRESRHDFGRDIIHNMLDSGRVRAYPFRDENRKSAAYWRDVGTLDSYYAANMDLIQVDPVLNLYDRNWLIRTAQTQDPPPKFVFSERGLGPNFRRGEATDSIVCPGCIISGGHVERSILARRVRVNSYATVEDSIVFENVDIGRHARIKNAIVDKDVEIPPGTEIGYDLEADQARGFTVSEGGVVVIAKAESVEAGIRRRDVG